MQERENVCDKGEERERQKSREQGTGRDKVSQEDREILRENRYQGQGKRGQWKRLWEIQRFWQRQSL